MYDRWFSAEELRELPFAAHDGNAAVGENGGGSQSADGAGVRLMMKRR
jgi:hypothetical protein